MKNLIQQIPPEVIHARLENLEDAAVDYYQVLDEALQMYPFYLVQVWDYEHDTKQINERLHRLREIRRCFTPIKLCGDDTMMAVRRNLNG